MEMVLRLPKNYVDVADDEMEYVEGGFVAKIAAVGLWVIYGACLLIEIGGLSRETNDAKKDSMIIGGCFGAIASGILAAAITCSLLPC